MQIDFTRATDKTYAEAIEAVKAAAAVHSFRVPSWSTSRTATC